CATARQACWCSRTIPGRSPMRSGRSRCFRNGEPSLRQRPEVTRSRTRGNARSTNYGRRIGSPSAGLRAAAPPAPLSRLRTSWPDGPIRNLFLPGYGATGRLYARGLEEGWQALEPPPFHATNGALASYVDWVRRELRRNDRPIWLAGHSMGGALAMLATTADPRRVARLTLASPAGLPLRKPIPASLVLFATQVARRRYGFDEIRREVGQALGAPRAALRLAQAVRRLDLTSEMRSLRASGVPVEVVGCST